MRNATAIPTLTLLLALGAGLRPQRRRRASQPVSANIKPDELPVSGGIPPDKEAEIMLVLQQREVSTRKCYQDVLNEKQDRTFQGNVKVVIALRADGEAQDVRVVGDHPEQQGSGGLPGRHHPPLRVPPARPGGRGPVRVPLPPGLLRRRAPTAVRGQESRRERSVPARARLLGLPATTAPTRGAGAVESGFVGDEAWGTIAPSLRCGARRQCMHPRRGGFGSGRAASLALLGCAQTEAVQEPPRAASPPAPPSAKPAPRPYRPGETPVTLGDEPDEAVEVSLDRGFLNQGNVNDVLAGAHRPAERLLRAGRRRPAVRPRRGPAALPPVGRGRGDRRARDRQRARQLPGRALPDCRGPQDPLPRAGGRQGRGLRILDGVPLAAPEVRRHLAARARSARPIAAKMGSLGRCGSPGEQPVQAVAYIKPNGWVASVGLASEGPMETGPARCLVDQIMRWRLRGSRGHVVRTSFGVNGAGQGRAAGPHRPHAPAPAPHAGELSAVSLSGRGVKWVEHPDDVVGA